MSEHPLPSIEACFSDLGDPRVKGRCEHRLLDIIMIAVCAVICGADGWVGIETFGKSKEAWLKGFLDLPNGIPSHDTFGRTFALLDAETFQAGFARWVEAVFQVTEGQVIAIDGKTVRRSHNKAIGKDAIHMISAWASANGIVLGVLGQSKVDDKSNEIPAIPELLKALDVMGCIVTIDAMGCQTEIARTVIEQKADYVLAVKKNQGYLLEDLQDWFAYADQIRFKGMSHSYHQTINKNKGRIEIRRCWAISDPVAFEYIRHYEGWQGLQTIIRVMRERRVAKEIQHETAYYISSLPAEAEKLLVCTRNHWSIGRLKMLFTGCLM